MSKLTKRVLPAFSSIEALIATSILVVGLLAIISLFPFILRINKQAEQTSTASALARAKMEQILVTSYDQLTIGTYEPLAPVTTDQASPLYIFERQTIISYVDANLTTSQSDLGLKKIITTVYWPGRQSEDNSLSIISLLARK